MCSYHITRKHGTALPNNQLHTEKWGGHYALFVAMLCSLHMYKKPLRVNPIAIEKPGKKQKESHNVCPNNQLHTEKWGGHCCSYAPLDTDK